MKYLGAISDAKDLVNKEYVDTIPLANVSGANTISANLMLATNSDRKKDAALSYSGSIFSSQLTIGTSARYGLLRLMSFDSDTTAGNSYAANIKAEDLTANRTFVLPDKGGTIALTTDGVTGVKGSSESSYRTGNVNLTAANVGALASNGTAVASNFLTSTDDRSNNRAPSYYMSKGQGTYNEFKSTSTIGTNTFMTTTYCSLTTYILWNDSSGGRPVQIAVDNNGVICHRWATSDSAWSAWVRIDNTTQSANATQSGTTWTAGSIVCYRRGTTCYLKINGATFSQITARTTVATVPSNFYPYTETSGYLDGGTVQIFITADGQLRINPVAAGQRWGGIMYLAAN